MSHRSSSARWIRCILMVSMGAALTCSKDRNDEEKEKEKETIFAPIAPLTGLSLKLKLVTDGLVAPLKGQIAPGEPGRLYVVNQGGELIAVDLTTGNKTLFLNVASRMVDLGVQGPGTFDERGFLGVAFHPAYRTNGKFYTYTSEKFLGAAPSFPTTLPAGTEPNHQNVIAEWHANTPGDPSAGATFVRELMRVDWPQFNHNAGDITFGPDGKLYIPMGDGGGADDEDGDQSINPAPGVVGHPGGNAQNLKVPLGKILRIDVDGKDSANGQYGIPGDNPFVAAPGAVKEIWAYGLRNPYRMSFDSVSGALIAGDVGQNDLEEVDVIVKGGNYGWNHKEGHRCFVPKGVAKGEASNTCPASLATGLIDPIAAYDTEAEGESAIGGFVYRGSAFPALKGHYVFGDYTRIFQFPSGPDNYGRLFYLAEDNLDGGLHTIKEFKGLPEEAARLGLIDTARAPAKFPQSIAVQGWAQDETGEIYVLGNRTGRAVGTGGFILKLEPGATP